MIMWYVRQINEFSFYIKESDVENMYMCVCVYLWESSLAQSKRNTLKCV